MASQAKFFGDRRENHKYRKERQRMYRRLPSRLMQKPLRPNTKKPSRNFEKI